MSDWMKPREPSAPPPCSRCGAPTTEVNSADVDEVGPRRVELECPNRHRLLIERVETYHQDPDLDLPYKER